MQNNTMIPYNIKKDLETNYYNKTEVELLIAGGSGGSIDLSDYYKKLETYSKAEVDALVAGGGADLSDYYTKEQVDSLISAIPETDLTNYYNKTQVDSLIDDISETDLSNYYDKTEVYNKLESYSKDEVDSLISSGGADLSEYYTKTEVDSLIPDISTKQDTLVSATNIKTINGESILGSGNLVISGGGSGVDGKSAYELYAETVPAGDTPLSELDWLESLKGKDFTLDDFLTDFSINGKNFDSNGNIDLEGLSTLSSPKLNEEVLTEFRHPVSGKPIYTKTIDFGALPNKTTKSVDHNIPNVDWISVVEASSYIIVSSDPTDVRPVSLPSVSALSSNWLTYVTPTSVAIVTGVNRTSWSGIITVQYTKTTDTAESPVRLVGGGLDPDKDIELSAGKGVVMTSENGTRYKLYIGNDGTLTTEVV